MLRDSLVLLLELALLFTTVATAVELLQRRLGPDRLRDWMGGRPVVAALKGTTVGFITPFCTYSALPLLVGLRRAGVTPAGWVAFIVAAPVLDPVLFGALAVIVGPAAAISYAVVAFVAAMTLALIAERATIERWLVPIEQSIAVGASGVDSLRPTEPGPGVKCAEPASGETQEPWRGLRVELAAALRSTRRLLRTLGPVLLLGVAIGVAIEVLVPAGTVADIAGGNATFAIPIAAALGTPLYFSTELFIPIAESLGSAGVGVGAIVALTISGAGANLPEFLVLGRLARPRLLAIFVGYVFAVAMIGGAIAELVTS